MPKIKTLIIRFNTPIKRTEIPLFRGAVIAALPSCNVLFHNHDGDKLRYAYPLIQYKRIGGNASIVCVGKGVESIGELLAAQNFHVTIGSIQTELLIESIKAEEVEIEENKENTTYSLHNWLPLNKINYQQYMLIDGLIERTRFLENILTGNILSLLKGVGTHIDFRLSPTIIEYAPTQAVFYKNVKLKPIDVKFKLNLKLPNHIGLGKHSSMGFGILTKE